MTIEIKRGKFSDEVDNIFEYLKNNPSSPTFSFVDPFGFGLSPFEKLKFLMHNEHSELFINFWCGFMNRFKTHPDENVIDKIKGMVGTDDLAPFIAAADPTEALCQSFEDNLKNIGRFTLKFAMRDEGNIRDNAFFFCGRQPRGFEPSVALIGVLPCRYHTKSAHCVGESGEITRGPFVGREKWCGTREWANRYPYKLFPDYQG